MIAAIQANQGRFFGIPFGDFGLFATILLSFSLGFLAFFATCFLAIFGVAGVVSIRRRSVLS